MCILHSFLPCSEHITCTKMSAAHNRKIPPKCVHLSTDRLWPSLVAANKRQQVTTEQRVKEFCVVGSRKKTTAEGKLLSDQNYLAVWSRQENIEFAANPSVRMSNSALHIYIPLCFELTVSSEEPDLENTGFSCKHCMQQKNEADLAYTEHIHTPEFLTKTCPHLEWPLFSYSGRSTVHEDTCLAKTHRMVAKDRLLAVQASACHAITQSLLVASPGRCAYIYMKWWYWYLHGSISCELPICDFVSHAMKFRQVSFLSGQSAFSESQCVPRQKQQNHTSGPAPKRPHS